MKSHPLSSWWLLSLAVATAALPLTAKAAPGLINPVTAGLLDPEAYSEWVGGKETPISARERSAPVVEKVVLSDQRFDNPNAALIYGDSKAPGVRHLRIGFKSPLAVGSVLVAGQGRLSVLKSDATYPGDLNDDSQWIPAQRIANNTLVSDEGAANAELLWVLPSVVTTRALRFTHLAKPTERIYGGSIGCVSVLSGRFANLAPEAVVTARSNLPHLERLIDETTNHWHSWANIENKDKRTKTIAEDPEWIILTWPTELQFRGLGMWAAGFSSAEVQAYNGPKERHPSLAVETDWKPLSSVSDLKSRYPVWGMDYLDFENPVTTRAIRLRLTGTFDPTELHPHLKDNVSDGKRIWLDELVALKPLGEADLKTALLPTTATAAKEVNAPIPVTFEMASDGYVTLVIEDATGKRVRNLIADTFFPKGGNTVYWDGTDDLGRDPDAPSHGLYSIPPQFVAPGSYTARGLSHPQINLHYEMSVYSPGNPAWPTADGSGGWMTNHTPASCVLFVPASPATEDEPRIYLGSYVSEGGSALSWLDLDGNKINGRGWIGGNWTGAQYLTRDASSDRDPHVITYVGASWKSESQKGKGEIRLTALTDSGDKPVLTPVYTFDLPEVDGIAHDDVADCLGGLAVDKGLLVLSQTSLNSLVMIDTKTQRVLNTFPLPNPTGLAFDNQGRLLALSGTNLLRFAIDSKTGKLGAPKTLVSNLEAPTALTLDSKGEIYVSDRGNSHQVKVFTSEGKPVKTFGKAGAPSAGIYDPDHMNNPKGLTVDSNGRLWVTEEDYQPKRVSIWNADGSLWKAFYGPQQYGGGGTLDPRDTSRFNYNGMEFHLDWKTRKSTLTRVYYRNDSDSFRIAAQDGHPDRLGTPPESAVYFNGHRYLTNSFSGSPTGGAATATIFLDRGDVVVPVAAAGRALDWSVLKQDSFKNRWPEEIDFKGERHRNGAIFFWSDMNGDGQVQPAEVRITAGTNGGVIVASDGSFLINNVTRGQEPGSALRFKPTSFTAQGVPVYAEEGEPLGASQNPLSTGGDQVLMGSDGWAVLTNAPRPFPGDALGGAKDGVAMWSYPSLWPGLHASHEAPAPSFPGQLIGTTRLLGDFVTPRDSDAGPLFFINSNMGNMYVFTQDGLFVTQLFHDVRQGSPWQMPLAQPGMLVNDLAIKDENFFPTVSQIPDGRIIMQTGSIPALVSVDGLEGIRRISSQMIPVSIADLKKAQEFVTKREIARQAAQGNGVLTVSHRSKAPTLDDHLKDWAEVQWAPIDQRGVAANFNSNSRPYDVNGAVLISGDRLFGLWKTGDPKLLTNSGEIANAPFKTGGALDLMLGTNPAAKADRSQPVAGDLRLLITVVDGKTKAMLYRPVVPGTPDNQKVAFSAPWHSITIDSVTDVSEQVQLLNDGTGNYQVSVPLSVLGLKPKNGMRIKGDLGILRGSGTRTTQRVYWSNKATAIVSDVPSEAMLTPGVWGTFEFKAP
ncbi:hypothetical protein V2O64_15925 [Verrucomicrobiaceae bacterium 227]